MPTHLKQAAQAKSHRQRNQACKVFQALRLSRQDKQNKLARMICVMERLREKRTFASLQKLPHLVYRLAQKVQQRTLKSGLAQW